MHLVGDLHQPLHVGFTDDLGGTTTKVWFDGKGQMLHDLWDTGLLEAAEKCSAKAIAELLDHEYSADECRTWKRELLRIGPMKH